MTYTKNEVSKIGCLKPPILHPILYVTRQVRRHASAPYGQPPLCRRVGIALIPYRQVRRQLSAPFGQPPLCRRVGIALIPTDRCGGIVGTLRAAATLPPSWHFYALIPTDRCGGMCRHPTGSRHFAAELDFMLLIAPTRQMRRQLSAPYGQPPICRRVGILCSSLATGAAAVSAPYGQPPI